ncbi:MAG: PEP-CTERM sorting domain-containing protein [Planctomycetales bacterium]|nr:PEP-CTERM sorting domain-containing protein [Planctomycetales bacterium]
MMTSRSHTRRPQVLFAMTAALLALVCNSADAVTTSYADAVLADSPVLYYRLGELAGTTAINSEGTASRDGTYTSGPSLLQAGPASGDGFLNFGPSNYAAGFGSGYVAIPAGNLPTGSSARTYEFFFNADGGGAGQAAFSYGVNLSGQRVNVTANNSSVAVAVNGHNYGTNSLSLSGWNHLAITLPAGGSSNDFNFYLNGALVGGLTDLAGADTAMNTQDSIGQVGGNVFGGSYLGLIDEFAVYNTDLSAAQIQNHFNIAQALLTPEPSTLLLAGMGLVGLCLRRRVRHASRNTLSALVLCLLVLQGGNANAAIALLDDHFDNGVVGSGGTNGGFTVATNGAGGSGTASEAGTIVDASTTGGANDNSGIVSSNSFNIHNGYTEVIATWVVASADNPEANGINLTLQDNPVWYGAAGGDPHLRFQFDRSNDSTFYLVADNGSSTTDLTSDVFTMSELTDGFTLTVSLTNEGWSYTSTGLASLADGSGLWDATYNLDTLFDTTTHVAGFIQTGGAGNVTISFDQISVVGQVPEPSTLLLAGLGLVGMCVRRKQDNASSRFSSVSSQLTSFAGSPIMNTVKSLSVALFAIILAASISARANAAMVNFWDFDDLAGTTATDQGTGGNNGTLNGNPQWVTNGLPSVLPSYPNLSALEFDGTGDWVQANGYSGITGTNARTVSAWIKTSLVNDAIVTWGSNAAGQKYVVRVNDTGANGTVGGLRLEVNGGYQIGSTVLNDDQWHHIALTWEDDGTPNVTDTLLYVDGVLETISGSLGQSINTGSANDLRIGSDSMTAGREWVGRLDEVAIFNVALDQSFITLLAQTGIPVPEPSTALLLSFGLIAAAARRRRVNAKVLAAMLLVAAMGFAPTAHAGLVGYWQFGEGAGTTTADSSVSGNSGLFAGNPQWSTDTPGNFLGANPNEYSLDFDGTGDEVGITGYKGVTGTASRTVAAWIKTAINDPNQDMTIASWGANTTTNKWTFRVQDDNGTAGALRVEVNGGYRVGSTVIADGEWHHVAAVLVDDGSPNTNEILLYVDGVLETNSATGASAINTASTADVRIGQDFSNRRWNGWIDEVRIYDHALSASEIFGLTVPVPEPSTAALLGLGLVGFAVRRRRRALAAAMLSFALFAMPATSFAIVIPDPGLNPNLIVWFKADDLGLSNGAGVPTLVDRTSTGSGIGDNTSQDAGLSDGGPTYIASSLNGLGGIDFGGAGGYTYSGALGIGSGSTAAFTMFVVGNVDGNKGVEQRGLQIGDGPAGEGVAADLTSAGFRFNNGNRLFANDKFDDPGNNDFHLGVWRMDAGDTYSQAFYALDGVAATQTSVGSGGTSLSYDDVGFTVGRGTSTGGAAASFWTGNMSEFLIFNRALTDEEVNLVGAYLEITYGLDTAYVNTLPEPSTAVLLGLGLVGFFARRRRATGLVALLVAMTCIASPATAATVILEYDATADTDADTTWEDTVQSLNPGTFDWALTGPTRTTVGIPQLGFSHAYTFASGNTAAMASLDGGTGNPTDEDATLEFWFRPNDLSGTEVLWEMGGATDGSSLTLNGSTLQFIAKDGGADGVVTTDLTAQDVFGWYHAAVTIDISTDTLSMYLNGTLSDQQSLNGAVDWAGADATGLGSKNTVVGGNTGSLGTIDGYTTFLGDIAIHRYYRETLTGIEIAGLFNQHVIPEPSTALLLGLGLVGLAARRRRHAAKAIVPIAAVACSLFASSAQAAYIIDLNQATALFDSNIDGQGQINVADPGAGNANGLTFHVSFTPSAADIASASTAVNLIDVGGSSNGTGLYLVGGELFFISKMNGAPADVYSTASNDLDFSSGNSMIGAKSSYGTLSAGVEYTVAAMYDPLNVGNESLTLAVMSDLSPQLTTDVFSLTGVGAKNNWSGDDSVTFLIGGSSGGATSNIGSDIFNQTDILGNPFTGIVGRGFYFNAQANLVAIPEPSTALLLGAGLLGLVARRRRSGKALASLALVACVAVPSFTEAGTIVWVEDQSALLFDSNVQGQGSINVSDPGAGNVNGLTFNVTFTPSAADIASSSTAIVLIETGGTSNGTGLFLLGGEVFFVSKMNGGPGDLYDPSGNDFDFASGNNLVGMKSTFGALTAGTEYTVAAIYDPLSGSPSVTIGVDPADAQLHSDTFALAGVGVKNNWSGDDNVTSLIGDASVAAGNNSAGHFFNEVDVRANDFAGIVGQGLYWNSQAVLVAVPEPSTALLLGLGLVGMVARRRRS